MLSGDILSQLSSLKQEIRASRDVAQGVVRGTTGRYGFVTLDDGRDAFLNPELMDRVFHGDRVEVLVTNNDKEQFEAKLEKLIHSPLKQVAGRYCIKGKGHFVIYETQQHTRWVFVPPKERANAQDGHYVTARILQHPYESGKSQAKIMANLGDNKGADIARKFTLAMHQLFDNFPKEVMDQAKALHQQPPTADNRQTRANLRHLPFVTIDSVNTKDMDDALTIETRDKGWLLRVAIADPGSEIAADSVLDTIAQRRAQTLYLPGKPVPMLPEILSTERYSLLPEQERLALVCTLDIDTDGKINHYHFESAIVQSKAKLSYQQVSALLNNDDYITPPQLNDAEPHKQQLLNLKACADTMNTYRKHHQLVTEHRADYLLVLNQEGKLDSIEKIDRSIAHTIVEEAMIATNQCAGDFLAKNKAGLFMVHPGFRHERRDDIEKLLKEKLGDDKVGNTQELPDYISVIHYLQNSNDHKNLLAVQQRFLQGSEPSLTPAPHFGLGATCYATVTSPIRRYQDLYNQRLIHQLLDKKKIVTLKHKHLEKLIETINNNRSASRLMEQWLIADYMQDKIGQTFTGTIGLLTNQGIGIRLCDTGIEGFIAGKREDKENPDVAYDKISFNNQRMELSWNGHDLHLDQEVEVTLIGVDMDKKKLILEWATPL